MITEIYLLSGFAIFVIALGILYYLNKRKKSNTLSSKNHIKDNCQNVNTNNSIQIQSANIKSHGIFVKIRKTNSTSSNLPINISSSFETTSKFIPNNKNPDFHRKTIKIHSLNATNKILYQNKNEKDQPMRKNKKFLSSPIQR
jgi:hypothetical protein